MWKILAPLSVVFLAACDAPNRSTSDPSVAAYYSGTPGEAVQVQVQIARAGDPMTARARTQVTANRVCGRRNQRAEHTMRREMMNQNWEDVFMCR